MEELPVQGFPTGFGLKTEWSLAWPGIGMALDCWALLISVLAGDVVVAGSGLGPAGGTPSTVVVGVVAASDMGGALTGAAGALLSEHATNARQVKTASTMAICHPARSKLFRPDPLTLPMAKEPEWKNVFDMVIFLTHEQGDQDDDGNRNAKKQQQK